MIDVQKITKNYGAVEAVKEVSFSAADGRITALLGPNGAGKIDQPAHFIHGSQARLGKRMGCRGRCSLRPHDRAPAYRRAAA